MPAPGAERTSSLPRRARPALPSTQARGCPTAAPRRRDRSPCRRPRSPGAAGRPPRAACTATCSRVARACSAFCSAFLRDSQHFLVPLRVERHARRRPRAGSRTRVRAARPRRACATPRTARPARGRAAGARRGASGARRAPPGRAPCSFAELLARRLRVAIEQRPGRLRGEQEPEQLLADDVVEVEGEPVPLGHDRELPRPLVEARVRDRDRGMSRRGGRSPLRRRRRSRARRPSASGRRPRSLRRRATIGTPRNERMSGCLGGHQPRKRGCSWMSRVR